MQSTIYIIVDSFQFKMRTSAHVSNRLRSAYYVNAISYWRIRSWKTFLTRQDSVAPMRTTALKYRPYSTQTLVPTDESVNVSRASGKSPTALVSASCTPNPISRMFRGPQYLLPGQILSVQSHTDANKFPLVKRLYEAGENMLRDVYVTDNCLTISLDSTGGINVEEVWNRFAPLFCEIIAEFVFVSLEKTPHLSNETDQDRSYDSTLYTGRIVNLFSGEAYDDAAISTVPEFSSGDDDTEPKATDSDAVLAIKELLATRVKPMLQGGRWQLEVCRYG